MFPVSSQEQIMLALRMMQKILQVQNGRKNFALSWLEPVFNAVLPPRCIQCGTHTHTPHTLCSVCWQHLHFFSPPWCSKCGLPLSTPFNQKESPADSLCISCLRYQKPFDVARSVFAYDHQSQDLLLCLKHHDRLHATPALSLWMARLMQNLMEDYPAYFEHHEMTIPIIPVPIHGKTLQKRHYYATAMLARQTARHLDDRFFFAPDVLERLHEGCQRGKNARERIKSIKDIYAVAPTSRALLKRQPLAILIDDVMTTGATISVCSHALRRAGVQHIAVITAARVPKILPRYPKWLA